MNNEELLKKENASRHLVATLQTIVLSLTIASSAWFVVDKLSGFEHNLNATIKSVEDNSNAIAALNAAANVDGVIRGEQTSLNRAILDSLNEIKRRLENIEQRSYRGQQP